MKEIKEATNEFQLMLEIIEKTKQQFSELYLKFRAGEDVKEEMENNLKFENYTIKEAEKKAHQIYELLKQLKKS